MREFVRAFGGLIGVGMIGIVFLVALIIVDWLIMNVRGKRDDVNEDEPPQ
jgi:hypothetical protein